MTPKLNLVARAIGLGLAGSLILAAGQYPVVATVAGPLAAGPAVETAVVAEELPAAVEIAEAPAPASFAPAPRAAASRPTRLATLVAQTIDSDPGATGDRECLARAVYFEARGEPLEGQLAVAQVILNRLASGRYASTVCGVVRQRGQFTFDQSRSPTAGRDWATAKAIAAIAANADWEPMVPRALSFHATRVNVSWTNMQRVSTIGNHVFYR